MLMLVAIVGGGRVVMTQRPCQGGAPGDPAVVSAASSRAALQIYPLGDRLILFAAPITALVLAAGVAWPARPRSRALAAGS
jgi:hypothetical protein